jgi:hypothetical protein
MRIDVAGAKADSVLRFGNCSQACLLPARKNSERVRRTTESCGLRRSFSQVENSPLPLREEFYDQDGEPNFLENCKKGPNVQRSAREFSPEQLRPVLGSRPTPRASLSSGAG